MVRLNDALRRADLDAVIAILEPMTSEKRRARLTGVFEQRIDAVTVLMDRPQDPHNASAVMRSCDAFGLANVHVVRRDDVFKGNNAVAKGAERWVNVERHDSGEAAAALLKDRGYQLVATHPQGTLEPADLGEIPKICLVMGNETEGIAADLEAACDTSVRIPMRGFVESLNVSVSAAILLSHATRGRTGDLSASELRHWYVRGLVQTVPRAIEILAASGVDLNRKKPPQPGSCGSVS